MKKEHTPLSVPAGRKPGRHEPLYLAGLTLLTAAKYYYGKAGSDDLLWILSPTAGLVTILSGIPFTYIPRTGYVSHAYQFIIAGSCSGFQFMIISSAMLFFSFLPRMKTRAKGALWLGTAVMLSYGYTIFVNSWRILVSVKLPLYLRKKGILYTSATWLSPERLHTAIGIFIYFSSLLVLYVAAEALFSRADRLRQVQSAACRAKPASPAKTASPALQKRRSWLIPVFWYFAIVLGIPLLNQAWRKDFQAFAGYSLLMLLVCLPVLLLFILAGRIFKRKVEGIATNRR